MTPKMHITKLLWPTKARVEFYNLFSGLLSNGADIPEALNVVREAFVARGGIITIRVIDDLEAARLQGGFKDTLIFYASGGERIMFSGYGSQDSASIFLGAATISEGRHKMSNAILSALVMPTLYIVLIGILGAMLHLQLFPAFEQSMDVRDFPTSARVLTAILQWMADYGVLLSILSIFAAFVVLLSMPFYAFAGRTVLDKLFPWSFYKLNTGIGFWLVVSALVNAGRDLTLRELEVISATMSLYGRKNVKAIIEQPDSLKLEDRIFAADKNWPERELNAVFRAFSSKAGGAALFSTYLGQWLQSVEARIKARAAVLNTVLLFIICALIMVVMFSGFQIFQQLSKGY